MNYDVADIKSPLRELALFAGAGGGILGGKLLGWQTVCAVEWEPYAACVLAARQNDGLLPPFPIWDDIQTFDGRPWRGIVDVVSGGFPCQDISAAGKGAGIDGERSGMWKHMARVVGEVRPRFVFVENSPMLVSRGGARVVADLAALGYDTRWTVMGAADVGAPHQRDRFWLVAHAESARAWENDRGISARIGRTDRGQRTEEKDMANTDCIGQSWQQRQAKGWETSSVGGCGEDVAYTDSINRRSEPQQPNNQGRETIWDESFWSSSRFSNTHQAGFQERDWRTTERGAFATSVECGWWNPEP